MWLLKGWIKLPTAAIEAGRIVGIVALQMFPVSPSLFSTHCTKQGANERRLAW